MTHDAGSSLSDVTVASALQCESVHSHLRQRAKKFRRVSVLVLAFMGVLLCAGSWFVINPPNLVDDSYYYQDYLLPDHDYYPNSNYDDKKDEPLKLTPGEMVVLEKIEEVKKSSERNAAMIETQAIRLEELESKNDGFQTQLGEVKKEVEAVKGQPEQERKKWEALLGVLATRFGIAALMVLLMRFMSSIYRYHARMAAFYDAKADVFEVCKEGDVQTMEKLSHMLTPMAVDFYETSDTIVEHAVDLAKRAASSHS